MNNVAYSCPWPSLLETARVTAHNRRAHLTGSVCWSVTTTQNGQMPFPRVHRHAQTSTALTEFNQRFVIFGPPPGDLQCLNRRHWQRGHLSSDVSSAAAASAPLFHSSVRTGQDGMLHQHPHLSGGYQSAQRKARGDERSHRHRWSSKL